MHRQQAWIENNNDLDHVFTNAQSVLRLNVKYEKHSCAEEFAKGCTVLFMCETYTVVYFRSVWRTFTPQLGK